MNLILFSSIAVQLIEDKTLFIIIIIIIIICILITTEIL